MRLVTTSSGFIFERRSSLLRLLQCPKRLVPLAELEYLREIEPRGRGRIEGVERVAVVDRACDVFTIAEEGGARREIRFDVGPDFFGLLGRVEGALAIAVYAMAGATAVGAMVYAMMRLVD